MKRCIMNKKSYDLTVDFSGGDMRYISSYRPIYVTYKNINGPIINSDSDMLTSPLTITLSATPGKGLLEIPSSNEYFDNISKEIEISNYNKSETVSVYIKKYTLGIELKGTSYPNLLAGKTSVAPMAWDSIYNDSKGYDTIYFYGIPAGECIIDIEGNKNFEPYTTSIDLYGNTTITANLTKKVSVFTIAVNLKPNRIIYISQSSGSSRTEVKYTNLTVNYVDQYGNNQNKRISSGSSGIKTSFTCLGGTTFSYTGSSHGECTSDNTLDIGGNTNYVYE